MASSSTMTYCYDWSTPTAGSPDYFNACGEEIASTVSIPDNMFGSQAARTGNAYMGMYVMDSPEGTAAYLPYREYLQGKIIQPLLAGHRYFLNYWVSKADNHASNIAVDRLSALFLTDSLLIFTEGLITIDPQVTSPEDLYFNSTESWMSVNGEFVAEGAEKWIILGNYLADESLNIEVSGPPIDIWNTGTDRNPSYYYIDDICLLDIDGAPTSFTKTDTLICLSDPIEWNLEENEFFRYYWSDGTTGHSNTFDTEGTYWVKTINVDQCTLHVDTINVINDIGFVLDLGDDTTICLHVPLVLDAGHPEITHYLWNTGETTSSIEIDQPGVYSVHATSDCGSAADTIVVSLPAPLNLELMRDTLLCIGQAITLSPFIIQPDVDYIWNTGSHSPTISTDESGAYILTAKDQCDNILGDTVNVYFSNCLFCIQMPNAFTPNGDGVNDEFKPVSECVFKDYQFYIYNRWGECVFKSFNVKESWNGIYNGKTADNGVYFYFLSATPAIGNMDEINIKGDITLIR